MGLTGAEKTAGRKFRDEAQETLAKLNESDPPTFTPPFFLALFRHLCPARNNKSTAIELKERFVFSPPDRDQQVPAATFGFLYREGRCRGCGQAARSPTGRLVDSRVRPPLTSRDPRRT